MLAGMDIDYIVVHCSATKPSQDIGVAEIREWHLQRGWSDIGYHLVIRRNGERENGRPMDQPGAHAKGYNFRSLGVCMVGGINEQTGAPESNFTWQQLRRLHSVLVMLTCQYPRAEVLGHRDLSPDVNHDGIITPDEWMKECPCFDVRHFWEGGV